MTREEALEKFELESDASSSEIQNQYQELYNEFQMRITNAPTDHQRKLYRKKQEEFEKAYKILLGHSKEEDINELPGLKPTSQERSTAKPVKDLGNPTLSEALKTIGFSEIPSESELNKRLEQIQKDLEPALKNSLSSLREMAALDKQKTDLAYQVIQAKIVEQKEVEQKVIDERKRAEEVRKKEEREKELLAQQARIDQEKKQQQVEKVGTFEKVESTKSNKKSVQIIAGVIALIIVLGSFVFKPWEPSIDPKIEKQFVVLKSQADLLAQQKNWDEALQKYREANELIANLEVQDSISSMELTIFVIANLKANADEDNLWTNALSQDKVAFYENYLSVYPEGRYLTDAIGKIEDLAMVKIKKMELAQRKKEEAAERKKKSVAKNENPNPKDAQAQFSLAIKHYKGNGVSKDYKKALYWFRKSVEQGNDEAKFYLGEMYQYGQGVSQDFYEAVNWYRKAAEQGNFEAHTLMSIMYIEGKGVYRDYEEALKWTHKAAELGYVNAQSTLGIKYYTGNLETPIDYSKAVYWSRKAAERGYDEAQYWLGKMYENGHGVSKDISLAIKWYRKAARQGSFGAQERLKELGETG